MEEIKVSVIVPVYNSAPYLRQCLDSIVGQSLKEIEIIPVDDGSDDGSVDILNEYAEQDARIRVMHQEHKYAGVARNTGKAAAKGKYLVFWDSDDYFKKDALKLMYEQCEADNADVCICGGRQYFDEEGFECPGPRYLKKSEIPETVPFNSLTAPANIISITVEAPWNKMFRREYIEEKGLDFQAIRNANDVYFTINALCLADTVTIVNKQLVVYRKSKGTGLVSSVSLGLRNAINAWIDAAEHLREEGRFPEESFANRALESIIYLLSNTADREVFRETVLYIKSEVLGKLSIRRPADDDNSYYHIAWQNEAARRLYDDTPEEFDRYLSHFYFARDAATAAKNRSNEEKNKKKIKQLTTENDSYQSEAGALREQLKQTKTDLEGAVKKSGKLEADIVSYKKELDNKNASIGKLKGTVSDQKDQIDLLGMSVRERDIRIGELERAIKDREDKIKKTEKKINDIKGSVSFKIGRGLTWIPRRIRTLIKRGNH